MTNQKQPVPSYVRRLVGEVRVYIDVNRFCNSDEEAAERIAANANWVIDRIRDNALDAAFLAPSSTDADGNNGYFRVEVSPIDPGYATLVATTKPFVSWDVVEYRRRAVRLARVVTAVVDGRTFGFTTKELELDDPRFNEA